MTIHVRQGDSPTCRTVTVDGIGFFATSLRHLDQFGAPVDTTDRAAVESLLANA